MNNTVIEIKIEQIKELQAEAKKINTKIEELQDELKAELTDRGIDELATDNHKVSWKECFSNSFDTKRFKAKFADLYNEFLRVNVTRRFLIA